MSIASEKRKAHAARMERLAKGLCKECDKPRGVNLNGSPSQFCDEHRNKFAAVTKKLHPASPTRPTPTPNIIRDYDGEAGYFETTAFKSYCKAVLGSISRTQKTSIGDIRRAMGEAFDDRRIYDALESLSGDGVIERQWGYRDTYLRIQKRESETQWTRDAVNVPPSAPRPDSIALYGMQVVY